MLNTTTLRALARAGALLVAGTSAMALAQGPAQIDVTGQGVALVTKARTVATEGLNLADARDQRRLDRRLQVASNAVCDVWDVSPTRPVAEFRQCAAAALANARTQAAQRSASNSSLPIRVSAG